MERPAAAAAAAAAFCIGEKILASTLRRVLFKLESKIERSNKKYIYLFIIMNEFRD